MPPTSSPEACLGEIRMARQQMTSHADFADFPEQSEILIGRRINTCKSAACRAEACLGEIRMARPQMTSHADFADFPEQSEILIGRRINTCKSAACRAEACLGIPGWPRCASKIRFATFDTLSIFSLAPECSRGAVAPRERSGMLFVPRRGSLRRTIHRRWMQRCPPGNR